MKFKIRTHFSLMEVIATPSQEEGTFRVDDPDFGTHRVTELKVSNVSEGVIVAVHKGDLTVHDKLVRIDPEKPHIQHPVGSTVMIATILLDNGDPIRVALEDIQEEPFYPDVIQESVESAAI